MKITIKDKEITLRYTFRALLIYEKIYGSSFAPKGITEMMVYFYSCILASDKDITLSFDEFMDWVDINPNVFEEFSMWLTSIIAKNSVMNESDGKDDETSKKK